VIPHELLLLAWRELDHSELHISMQRREDPIVDAKIGVTHVSAFERALHAKGDATESLRPHAAVLLYCPERSSTVTSLGRMG
jgi:hypothetical protein